MAFLMVFSFTGITNAAFAKSPVSTESRTVGNFSKILSRASVDIVLVQGDRSIKVEADERVISHLYTEVHNGILEIGIRNYHKSYNTAVVYVSVENIDEIRLDGSGDLSIPDTFSATSMDIKLNGSGDIDADLNVKDLGIFISGSGDAKISGVKKSLQLVVKGSGDVVVDDMRLTNCSIKLAGSGDVDLSGTTEKLIIGIAGSGNVDADDLKAVDVDVSIAGSGDAQVYAVNSLSASTAGSGDISYRGNPDKVSVSTVGSGDIYRR